MPAETSAARKTEIIAFCSGKGGAGKTLFASCLGFALTRSGLRVLMIDGDPATDGLSLFLLGPKGMQQIARFNPDNTFTGVLRDFEKSGTIQMSPRLIHRNGDQDHGVSYEALISGRGLYGEVLPTGERAAVPDLDQRTFRAGIGGLFEELRRSNTYDYVLVDTRGGFAFESTDVCALADSFLVVTEADYTSFFQDRNLIRRIADAADELKSPSILRSVVVNKAVDGIPATGVLDLALVERSFRFELTKEFPVKFDDTHPIPADVNVLLSYKSQRIPLLAYPASPFSFATISAFSDILGVVTSQWSVEQAAKWNELVNLISAAIQNEAGRVQERLLQEEERGKELVQLRDEVARNREAIALLKKESDRIERVYEREIARTSVMQPGSVPFLAAAAGGAPPALAPPSGPVLSKAASHSHTPQAQRPRSRWPVLVLIAGIGAVLALLLWYGRQTSRQTEAYNKQVQDILNQNKQLQAAIEKGEVPSVPKGSDTAVPTDGPSTAPQKLVYLQIGREEDRRLAEHLATFLQNEGYSVAGVELVKHPPGHSYVRYFEAGNRADATRLVVLMARVGVSATAQNFSKIATKDKGSLEVWLGDGSSGLSDSYPVSGRQKAPSAALR